MDIASGTNYADFGEYTLSSVLGATEDNIAWLNMPSELLFWYSAAVQAIQIGDNEYTATKRTAAYYYGEGNSAPVIYDTGTSLIYAPAGLGYELLARMVGDNTHYFDYASGIMLTSCAEKNLYETVYLWIDDYRFEISIDDYWIEYNDIVDGYDAD